MLYALDSSGRARFRYSPLTLVLGVPAPANAASATFNAAGPAASAAPGNAAVPEPNATVCRHYVSKRFWMTSVNIGQ
jgi:hypothetical protein